MNVSVIVATYGAEAWRRRGDEAATDAAHRCPAGGIVRLHLGPEALKVAGAPLARARNLAAEGAIGEWLCFLDADDRLEPGYLSAMKMALRAYFRPAVRDVRTESGPRPTTTGDLRPEPLFVPAVRYHGRDPAIPDWHRSIYDVNCACVGTLIRREFFLKIGGFGDEPVYEDWALWLKAIAEQGARLVPVTGAVYRAGAYGGDGRNQVGGLVAAGTYAEVRRRHAAVPNSVWEQSKEAGW